jgi:predicted nucleotidyltransferase
MKSNVSHIQDFLRENHLFSRFNLRRIGIFGSFARNDKNAGDIDILIDEDIDPEKMIEFKTVLEDSFQKKVDVVLKKFANPIILYRAQKDLQYATQY